MVQHGRESGRAIMQGLLVAHVIVTDIYWDVNLQDFLKSLEAAGGPHIQGYKAEGPGGGNPMLTLEFDSEDQARKFLADNGLE